MNWLTLVLVIVIAASTFMGLKMGIIRAVLSLAGLIIGVVLAGRFYIPLSEQLTLISSESAAKVAAFAIILVAVMAVAGVLAWLLKRLASLILLGWLNRIGGAVLGLFLGAIFCGALLALWTKYMGPADVITGSGLAALLLDSLPLVLGLLPDEFEGIRTFFQQ